MEKFLTTQKLQAVVFFQTQFCRGKKYILLTEKQGFWFLIKLIGGFSTKQR